MVQLTIEVPEELAVRLQSIQHRLIDILELGLRELNPNRYTLIAENAFVLDKGCLPPTPTLNPVDSQQQHVYPTWQET